MLMQALVSLTCASSCQSTDFTKIQQSSYQIFEVLLHYRCLYITCASSCQSTDFTKIQLSSYQIFEVLLHYRCLYITCASSCQSTDFTKIQLSSYQIFEVLLHYRCLYITCASSCSPGSFDEYRTAPSSRRPKTKPDDLGCESACTGCQSLHPATPFIITTQPES